MHRVLWSTNFFATLTVLTILFTYSYGASWTQVSFAPEAILPINSTYDPAITVDAVTGDLWLFGGSSERFSLFDDTSCADLWKLDAGINKWVKLGPPSSDSTEWPSSRTGATLALAGDHLFLFGGIGDLSKKDDIPESYQLWVYNIAQATWDRVDCRHHFSCPTSMVVSFIFMRDLFWTPSSNELWHFDPISYEWVSHGRIPTPSKNPSTAVLFPDYKRGKIIALMAEALTDRIVDPFFIEYDLDSGLWEGLNVSGRFHQPFGPTLADNTRTLTSTSGALSFLAATESGSFWPDPKAFSPSNFHVFDASTRTWANLPRFAAAANHLAGFVYASSGDGKTIIAIGGQGQDYAFEMWKYDVSCPDCSGHGICASEAYCLCESSRFGGPDCSADCGIASCGNGYCLSSYSSGNSECQCADGFIGSQCDIPFQCEGDGMLVNVNNTATCVCKQNSGSRCEIPYYVPCHFGMSDNGSCTCFDDTFGNTCQLQAVVTEAPVLNCTEGIKSAPASWSWCFKRNVMLAPVRIPVTNTSDDDPLMKEPSCMDNSTFPNSTCKAISSLDLLGAVRPSNANSRGFEIESLILVGLGSGEFGAVSFTGENIVGHWSLDSSPILFLRSRLLVESSLSRNPLALFCAADKNGFGLYTVGQNGTESVFKSNWMRPSDKIVALEVMAEEVPRGNVKFSGFFLTIWALFVRPQSQEWFLQTRVIGLDTTTVNSSRFDPFGPHPRGFTWKIHGSGVEGDLKMARVEHNSQLDSATQAGAAAWNPSCNLGRESRSLLVIHSESTVGVFSIPPVSHLKAHQIDSSSAVADLIFSSLSSENRGALIISLIDKGSSPSAAITGVSIFSDCWPTISAQSNGLWLIASVMGGNQLSENRLEILKLSEFELHSRGCSEPLLPERLDSTFPVTYASSLPCDPSIVHSPTKSCDISRFWWNSSSCEARHRQSFPLPFSPVQLERRFVGEPRGLVDTPSLRKFKASNNQTLSVELESFLYNAVFIRDSSHRVHIWGMQEDLRLVNQLYNNTISTLPVRFVELSSFYSAAQIEAMAVSENGEHAFVATSQQKWQIDSQRRLVEICETRVQNDTAKALLQAYEPLCEPPSGLKPAKPSIAHFVFFMSMCTSGIYCPSFVSQVAPSETPILAAQQPEGGTYALFPGRLRNCSKGNFCSDGKEKQCPIGFKCPYERMSLPIRCEPNPHLNTTCFSQGLANEMPCPSGFVCTGMDVPPTPAPAGYYLRNSTTREGPGTMCSPGDFCALGAGDPAPACPAGFYCSDPSGILPFMCPTQYDQRGIQIHNATSYCPAGSASASWCPPSFYCETPWTKTACSPGQWCPEGTQVPKECPAGRLCSTPGDNIPCPAGFYCPPGTSSAIRCSPLSLCAEGSSQERRWLALLIESIAIVVVGISYKLITIWNNRRWKINMEKRQQLRAHVVNRYAAPQSRGDEDSSDELPLLSGHESSSSQSSIVAAANKVSPRPGLTIRFENLELKVGKKSAEKTVLESVSGQFLPGQLHAVMGPSGAGKTSLISVLSGQVAKTSGEILVNGLPQPNLERFKSVLGFVPQEDIMHRTLTVREILDFNAATRLDSRLTAADREDLVDDIIDILGLKKVEHSIVGDENRRGLSGGERKRVNVGMELAADPSILFLDEPTSGLDSTSAVQVIQCLKSIASRSNMTIICVIHQPRIEVFRLFDTVLFLQPGGRTVFQGVISEAETYFDKQLDKPVPVGVNAADFYMDVISNSSQQQTDLSQVWTRTLQEQQRQLGSTANDAKEEESGLWVSSTSSSLSSSSRLIIPFKPRTRAGFFYQLWLLFIRSLTLQLRDISSYLLNIFLIFIAGLLLGFIYSGSTFVGPASPEKQAACPEFVKEICAMPIKDEYVGEFTLLVLSLGLTGVASALNTFGSERITFWRESRAGINSLAFFIAKNLASIPMLLLPPLFLWSIFYFLTSPLASFGTVYGVLIAVQFSCAAAGYVISLLVAPHSALLAGVVYVVICTLFSGSNPSLKKLNNYGLPAQILYNMSFSRWSVEALYCAVLTEYSATDDIQSALDFWGYNMHNFAAIDVLCILSIGFVLLIAAYFILLFFHARRK